MLNRAAIVVVAVALVSCRCGPPLSFPGTRPPCGVENIEQQALTELPEFMQIDLLGLPGGDIRCTPGLEPECPERLAGCIADLGDVAIGDVARFEIVTSTTNAFGAGVVVNLGDCPDVYVESTAFDGELQHTSVVVRPSGVGVCTARIAPEVAVPADNVPAGFSIVIVSNRVAGAAPGCTAEDACCCPGDGVVEIAPPRCDGDRLVCVGDGAPTFTDRCSDECVAGGTPDEAVVRLEATSLTPAAGSSTTISWRATNATSCDVAIDGTSIAQAIEGSVALPTPAAPVTAVASCLPAGAASVAALRIAPACDGEVVVDGSVVMRGGQLVTGADEPIELDASSCVNVLGSVRVIDPDPVNAARITRADVLELDDDNLASTDFVALTSAAIDTLSGTTLSAPAVIGLTEPYLALPSLASTAGPIHVSQGRVDVRSLQSVELIVDGRSVFDGPSAIDVGDGVTVTALTWSDTIAIRAPIISGRVARVTGDVIFRENPLFAIEEIDAFVAQLGTIDGTITTCGNFGDDPCP